MTDCAMHFRLCTHLNDSYQHCFYADIAFVYLLLLGVLCDAVALKLMYLGMFHSKSISMDFGMFTLECHAKEEKFVDIL